MFILLVALLVLLGAVLLFSLPRTWCNEQVKAISDSAISFFLRSTSRFEKDLTEKGQVEREMWRNQRLRNFRNRVRRNQN